MDEFRALLSQAQASDAHSSDIQNVLLQIQKSVNFALFRNLPLEQIESVLGEIWKFLLFSAAHSASSIRLASYRATGIFLLRITPYFPQQVQRTFSKVSEGSTVDLKSSAVIAASFAFISRTVALPYLERFLDTTPVYHDFAISDPIFSEHLGAIISNIGNVGLDWFRTLLHSFLALVATSTDRYLLHSIVAIVKHHPVELVSDILQFVKEQANMKAYLALVSFVLTSMKRVRFDDFDLYDVARESVDVLEKAEEANLTDIDSAMQILSIQSKSFSLEIEGVDDDNLVLVLSGKGDKKQVAFNIKQYRNRTAFFLLQLPLRYAQPDIEKDGALTLTAKLLCMASVVVKHPELAPTLFQVVETNMQKEYCDIVSACMQAMSKCLFVLLEQCDRKKVVSIVYKAIFTQPVSWFHAADILRILDAIPVDEHEAFFGQGADIEIIDLWIRLCLSQNELVGKKAEKALVAAVRESSFEIVTTRICLHLDTYDRTSLMRLLRLLTLVLEKYPDQSKEHIKPTMWVVIELCELYQDDIQVLEVSFEFLSHFEIDSIKESLKACMSVMFAVMSAEIHLLSGELLGDPGHFQTCHEAVETAWQAMNLDIISDAVLSYESCMRPLLAALKLFSSITPRASDDASVLRFCRTTVCIFPHITVAILDKYSAKLNPKASACLFGDAMKRLEYIQDYSVAASLCKLVILNEKKYGVMIERNKTLIDIARFAVKTGTCVTDVQRTIFQAFLWVLKDGEAQNYEHDIEQEVLENCVDLYSTMFKKDAPESKSEVHMAPPQPKFEFSIIDEKTLATFDSHNESLIKTQLTQFTYEFSPDVLQTLFDQFCSVSDICGLDAVFKYAAEKHIILKIDPATVPMDAVDSLLRYQNAVESPGALELALKFSGDSSQRIAITAISFCSGQYLQRLSDADKIRKRDLGTLTRAMGSAKFDSLQIYAFFMKHFNNSVSKNKLSYLLVLLDCFLESGGELSQESLDRILAVIQERFDELPAMRLARCIKAFIPLAPQKQASSILDKYMNMFQPVSPMIQILHFAASTTKDRVAVFEREVPTKAEELMKRRIPSYFFSGVRLCKYGLQQLPDKRVQSLTKHCLNLILQTWPSFMCLHGIADEIGASLNSILKNPLLKKFHSHVLQNAPKLIPDPYQASFLGVSECLIELSSQSLVDEQVVARIRHLVTNPMCTLLMTVFVQIVDIAAQKLGESEARSYVMKTAERWIDRNLKKFDCYSTADIVHLWLTIIHKYHPIENMLPLLTERIFANSNRFFPSVVGIARFVSDLNPTEAETVKQHLKESAETCECHAHKLATQLIFAKPTARVALRLASFDTDCPSSAAIIASLNDQQFT